MSDTIWDGPEAPDFRSRETLLAENKQLHERLSRFERCYITVDEVLKARSRDAEIEQARAMRARDDVTITSLNAQVDRLSQKITEWIRDEQIAHQDQIEQLQDALEVATLEVERLQRLAERDAEKEIKQLRELLREGMEKHESYPSGYMAIRAEPGLWAYWQRVKEHLEIRRWYDR
jgi:hypothetical protein